MMPVESFTSWDNTSSSALKDSIIYSLDIRFPEKHINIIKIHLKIV